ncbi:MAG: tetratricopeptide repeat protein [Parvibaculum sp.]|nr:tetratricopeptide repeat protein [Parvibaculum sp.]
MKSLVDTPLLPCRRQHWLAAATLCSAIALTGCANTGVNADGASPMAQAQNRIDEPALRNAAVESTKTQDYVAAAAYWGTLYERDPDQANAAVNYSRALRQIGSVAQATSVMQRTHLSNSEDPEVLAEFGKALAAGGRADQASAMLGAAARLSPKDWSVHSALGVAHDQMGLYEKARQHYDDALAISPDNPSVLTNLGLSHALSGNLDQAEQVLRRAVADSRADAHARQNLAIVLGLKGNFDEAARLARADLPANVADGNIAYLRDMLSQPALWQQMKEIDAPGDAASSQKRSSRDVAAPDLVSSMPPETGTSLR